MKSQATLKPFTIVTRKRADNTITHNYRHIYSPNMKGARASGRAMAEIFNEYYIAVWTGHTTEL